MSMTNMTNLKTQFDKIMEELKKHEAELLFELATDKDITIKYDRKNDKVKIYVQRLKRIND